MAKGDYETRHLDENHPFDGSGMATRTCTDLPCLVVFIFYMIAMCSISIYGYNSGNPRRLTHGFNYKGELCGVDENVLFKPLIFWCRAGEMKDDGQPKELDTEYPICVRSCPSTYSLEMTCAGRMEVKEEDEGSDHMTILTQSIVKQQSYPTMEFAGMYCVPHTHANNELKILGDDPLTTQLMGPYGPLANSYFKISAAFGSLRRCWKMVAWAAVGSVVLSYVYLGMLRLAPYATAFTSICISLSATLLASLYFLLGEYVLSGSWEESYLNSNTFYKLEQPWDASIKSKLVGWALFVIFLFWFCGLAFMKRAITTALGCVNAAVECIFSMPTMLLTPIFEAAFKSTLWFILLMGIINLLGTGSMEPEVIEGDEGQITSVKRKLVFSHEQYFILFTYVLGAVWLIEVSRSLTTFVISYAVTIWYYTEIPKNYGPSFPLMRGLIIGTLFHSGTIVWGALCLALTRPFRMVFLLFSRHAKENGNPVLAMCASFCSPCVRCAQRNLEFITKNAYIDTVLSSKDFLTSAQNSHGFIDADRAKVKELTGALWVISLSVVSGIFVVTVSMLWFILSIQESQNEGEGHDVGHEVENPYFVVVMSGILAASLSGSFMVVFEHCSDTLLYIFLWNKSHGHNTVAKYCPEALSNLMGYQKTSEKSGQVRPEQPGIFSTFGSFFQDDKKGKGKSPEETVPLVS